VVFDDPIYRLLWTSSLFSFMGMNVQMVARALLAWELTESFGAVGAISLSFGLPMLLFSLVGGSLADRLEKRNLSLVTQSATGVLALGTAVLVATGAITFELLFAVGLVQGTLFAFGMPARGPLMAEVVGRRLCGLADGRQVLCVTHLAQIAALADCHLLVRKETARGSTTTAVHPLEADRDEEIARMLGGRQDAAVPMKHAREILEGARTWKRKAQKGG